MSSFYAQVKLTLLTSQCENNDASFVAFCFAGCFVKCFQNGSHVIIRFTYLSVNQKNARVQVDTVTES